MLLRYIEMWVESGDSEIVVALVDSVAEYMSDSPCVSACYVYGRALFVIATSVDYSAGLARLQSALSDWSDDRYVVHAIIAAMSKVCVPHRPIVDRSGSSKTLIDAVISGSPPDDWLVEELARALRRLGFYQVGPEGFVTFLDTIRAPYKLLRRLLTHGSGDVTEFDICGLVSLLESRKFDRGLFHEFYDATAKTADGLVRSCLDRFYACAWPDETAFRVVAELRDWAEEYLQSRALRLVISRSGISDSGSEEAAARELSLVSKLLRKELEALPDGVTASEYLVLETLMNGIDVVSCRRKS